MLTCADSVEFYQVTVATCARPRRVALGPPFLPNRLASLLPKVGAVYLAEVNDNFIMSHVQRGVFFYACYS